METVVRCFLILVGTAVPLVAQAVHSPGRKVVDLPSPTMEMRDEGIDLGSTIRVAVTVDEEGNVISVGDATGPGWVCAAVTRPDIVELREKAKDLAAKAKFEPLPVNATGPTLSYVEIELPSKPKRNTKEKNDSSDRFTLLGGAVENSAAALSHAHVLNGKALSLPKPHYPPAARAVRAEGAVQIQVLIDEDGNIFSAAPVGGHPLLRNAARQAACGAKFSPTLLSGSPVKVAGVITYNFVP